MRIGIISKYYKNYNFGGLLQSYALVKALEHLGYEAHQISFVPDDIKRNGLKSAAKQKVRAFMRIALLHIKAKSLTPLNSNMKRFMKEIPHSSPRKGEGLQKLNREYDLFIAGSDQIWNPSFAYDAYFLDFADSAKGKISYAASIGVTDCSEAEQEYLKKNIDPFQYVSLREREAVQLLHKILPDKKLSWVLDPTFLLKKEEWALLDKSAQMNLPKRYAAVYLMGNDENNAKLVHAILKEMNLPVVKIPFTVSDYAEKNVRLNLGPKEFVSIIRNAEVVLTDSFHATVFSIINEVNFYCFSRNGANKVKSMNSRMNSLFSLLGIEPRWVERFEDYQNLDVLNSFEGIHAKIDGYRMESLEFLQNAIEGKVQTDGISICKK